jgi:hypothetical protein
MLAVITLLLAMAGCSDAGSADEDVVAASLTLSAADLEIMDENPGTLTATLLDATGRPIDGSRARYEFTWSVLQPNIVDMDAKGNKATLSYRTRGTTVVRVTAHRTTTAPSAGISASVSVDESTLSTSARIKTKQKPADLIIARGNGQKGRVKTVLPEAVVVQVRDKPGRGVPDQPVRFTAKNGGTVTVADVVTDSGGFASTSWELGPPAGGQQLEVVAPAGTTTFNAEAAPAEPSTLQIVSGDGQSGAAGTALPANLVAAVLDQYGNPVPGAIVSWKVASGGGSLQVVVSPSDTAGRSTALWTLGSAVGEQQASAEFGAHFVGFKATATAASPVLSSVTVSPSAVTLDGLGLSTQLSAVARDKSAATLSNTTFTWASSNAAVATVDAAGKVTAKAVGLALVIATAAGVADTAHVAVRQVPASIQLSSTSLSIAVGGTAQLQAVVKDAGGATIASATVAWTSSAPSVATVAGGLVTGTTAGTAVIAATSNGVTASAQATVTAPPPPTNPPPPGKGVWISTQEIAALPTSGAAWTQLYNDAKRDPGTPDLSNQDAKHGHYVMAAALVCARTGEFCAKAEQGILSAIGTEQGARWLAIGRTLGAYVIAADVMNLRADGNPNSAGSRVEAWMRGWLTTRIADNVSGQLRTFAPYHSGSNAAAQEGFVHAAVAAYLSDTAALKHNWDMFRVFVCDAGAPNLAIDLGQGVSSGWAHDSSKPCAINPKGTTKQVPAGRPGAGGTFRIDGSIINDMRRGGDYQWEPGWTGYPWTGLAGIVPGAAVLHRQGFPAFDAADRAVLRTHEYLWFLSQNTATSGWFDGSRGSEVVQLVNHYYGASYSVSSPTQVGHTIGYTGWTHPRR